MQTHPLFLTPKRPSSEETQSKFALHAPCSLLPFHSIQSSCSRDRISKARSASIENAIVSIEKHITVDILGPASNALQRSEASASAARGAEIHQGARDGSVAGVADGDGEVWEGGRAVEGVAALAGVVGGARYLGVVV